MEEKQDPREVFHPDGDERTCRNCGHLESDHDISEDYSYCMSCKRVGEVDVDDPCDCPGWLA